VPGLGTTYGRGGATTAPSDLVNSDVILIMGSNMAENHPVGFQWVIEAKEHHGAHVIHVDPRFSRTSAVANTWVPLRAGSDILFLGGLINHILQNELDFREYVVHYTNASVIIPESFKDTEELGGIFSGWDPEKKQYDTTSWLYQGVQNASHSSDQQPNEMSGGHSMHGVDSSTDLSTYEQDLTLQHPRCVYQIMKRHFARYTPEMVERYCGVAKEAFLNVANLYCGASGPEKTAAICYALGWTQHSSGVQMIRCAAILQLLLGNMGRPGGGILALRGHASIQGSTDIPTLFDSLPGYLSMPKFGPSSRDLASFIKANKPRTGFWNNFDKYIVSQLKAFYGDAATKENDFGFNWLPRLTGDHSHQAYWLDMLDGKMDGLFVMGQNPAVAGPNSGMERRGLGKLKWLVVREMVETETASFWYASPEVQSGDLRTEDIETEVFLMPAAGHVEKEGTFTNTQRLLQWREKAVDPPGDARSENWFIYHLWRRIVEKAKLDPRPRNQGLLALTMNYTLEGDHREPASPEILQEINGWTVADHKLLSGFGELKADGSTLCGCWIYSGCFNEAGNNMARRDNADKDGLGTYAGWTWSWPLNRRILYNRASADMQGKPWDPTRAILSWDGTKWTGGDVPDIAPTAKPDVVMPFIMNAEGSARLFVRGLMKDGPFPVHYEPFESPIANPVNPKIRGNPGTRVFPEDLKQMANWTSEDFPYAATSYRLTEHFHYWTKHNHVNAVLQPEFFVEISEELAKEKNIALGGWVRVWSKRGSVKAKAVVTKRIRPLICDGKTVHIVGIPLHWGFTGAARKGWGPNSLTPFVGDANSQTPEFKAFLVNIEPTSAPTQDPAQDRNEV